MRRETCICEMPTCWAICDCVSPSKNRRWRILRSRSSSTLNPGASTARSSDTSYWCSTSPSDSSGSSSSPSSVPPPVDSESEEYARPDSSASSTASSSTPAAFASSGIVGERPSRTLSLSDTRPPLRQPDAVPVDVHLVDGGLEHAPHSELGAGIAPERLEQPLVEWPDDRLERVVVHGQPDGQLGVARRRPR